MSGSILPSIDTLRRMLIYDDSTGQLFWRESNLHPQRIRTRLVGRPAGGMGSKGYLSVCIHGKQLRVHRVVWAFIYGTWPPTGIDHKNGNTADNRVENLRLASPSQNGMNAQKKSSARTSTLKGVAWNKRKKKFEGRITFEGRRYFLGLFDAEADCHAAYCEAAKRLAGEFARAA